MSTETKTEELRERLSAVIWEGERGWLRAEIEERVLDRLFDVLRADPSAVIAALGGTQIGHFHPRSATHRAHLHMPPDDDYVCRPEWYADDPAIVPVWVLGEQP